ncbi:Vps51/Vps67-domain-containing protein [Sordaria brevicollis]|uniref:Vacuolar protein sorting-associated protein 51 homolog n=1 Tax=Sordaria brevicollis TaxID=83679 RepID=A0AAE0P142_SORBR|nr:Vps51/Vps67-domain-containing protein [Sordaria brevicollis]
MSTIATPRDTGTPLSRRINSSQALNNSNTTPTSSTRPSLDVPRSASSSPNPSAAPGAAAGAAGKRANRAALREYYNLKKAQAASATGTSTPILEVTSTPPSPDPSNNGGFQQSLSSFDSIPASPVLDSPDFSAQPYLNELLQSSTLAELLKTYARILSEIRALDAEKKALVYDNYSKLISATETIRKMRSTMFDSNSSTGDRLDPMASTLDAVLGKVYELASRIRGELRQRLSEGGRGETAQPQDKDLEEIEDEEERRSRKERRDRTRELAREVVKVPERLRTLMKQGKKEEAAKEWELPRRLLERWKEKGVGGDDVGRLLDEGDAIVTGDEGGKPST